MQGHDADLFAVFAPVIIHDQADMLQKALKIFKAFQRLHQFLEVFQTARRFGGFVILPHRGVAGFVQNDLSEFNMANLGFTKAGLWRQIRAIVQHGFVRLIIGNNRAARHIGPAGQTIHQLTQGRAALALDRPVLHRDSRPFQQAGAVRAGNRLNGLLRLIAQPAFGGVHDPFKRQIVTGRCDQTEIGHRIANLHPFIETGAADDAIRQTDGQKTILERAHLVAGTHQNGDFIQPIGAQSARAALQGFDVFTDPNRFLLAIPMTDQTQLFAAFGIGPQGFAKAAFIALNHIRGRRQNMRGRAVILFQTDHGSAGKILFKSQDIAHFGPAPAIDRLIVIAHAADVFMPPRQQAQPQVLGHVGILIFVHKDVAEPAAILVQNVGVFLENRHHMQQQIAEIGGVQFDQAALILVIEFDTAMIKSPRIGGGHLRRGQSAVFPIVDDPGQQPGRPAFFINLVGLNQLLQQAQLIVCVQNGEVGFQPHQFSVAAQQFHADRMKRTQPAHTFDGMAQQMSDTVLHFPRSLVGEGHGQNLIRLGAARGHQMGNSRG